MKTKPLMVFLAFTWPKIKSWQSLKISNIPRTLKIQFYALADEKPDVSGHNQLPLSYEIDETWG